MSTYQSRFTLEVAGHLQKAIEYYDQLAPHLGDAFFEDFGAQINSICTHPYVHAIRYNDIRFALIRRFHYSIHYTIDEVNKEVVILAVYSTHITPDTYNKHTEQDE